MKAFPVMTEAIAHTVLTCERCLSAILPRDRDILTLRTELEPLTAVATGMALNVANFQLSMPHVDGCCRRQMPLQAVAVQLPKSELKFAVERMERCPITPRLTSSPQYRPRPVEIITQQNHLHQVGSLDRVATRLGFCCRCKVFKERSCLAAGCDSVAVNCH